jgi:hypothetical protein
MADENEETTTSEQEEGAPEGKQPRTAKNTVAVEDVGPQEEGGGGSSG